MTLLGGIGQPLSLLLKTSPLISEVWYNGIIPSDLY